MKQGYLSVLILVSITTDANAVGIGATCSVNADCSVTNYDSYCNRWFTAESCRYGICKCNEGYGGHRCAPLQHIVGHGEICNSTSICDKELTCTAVCVCATTTYVYKEATNLCLAIEKRVVGQTCNNSSDCYNRGGADGGIECNDSATKTCQCKSGYVQTIGLCHMPYFGQPCNTDVGCRTMDHPYLVIDDASRVTEQCISGVCGCPEGSDMVNMDALGTLVIYCLQTPTVPLKAAGQSCTTSSECVTKLCTACPGSSNNDRTCTDIPSSTGRVGDLILTSVQHALTAAVLLYKMVV